MQQFIDKKKIEIYEVDLMMKFTDTLLKIIRRKTKEKGDNLTMETIEQLYEKLRDVEKYKMGIKPNKFGDTWLEEFMRVNKIKNHVYLSPM